MNTFAYLLRAIVLVALSQTHLFAQSAYSILDSSDINLARQALRRQEPAAEDAVPAVVVRVSEHYVRSQMTRKIDTTVDVDQVVLGTRARGRARTTGTGLLEFKPSDKLAAFQIRLTGFNVSDTVGRNGPAVIYTRSTSKFTCVKPILFSRETGFITTQARVDIATDIQTRGVGATVGGLRGCIVRRVAWRRALAAQPQVAAIARQKADERIRMAVDQQVDRMLADLNRRTDVRQLSMAFLGINLAVHTSTTDSELTIILAADSEQLALVKMPPRILPDSGIEISIHRSLIAQRLDRGLAGFIQIRDRVLPMLSLISPGGEAPLAEGNRPLNVAMFDSWIVLRPSEEVIPPRLNLARRPVQP